MHGICKLQTLIGLAAAYDLNDHAFDRAFLDAFIPHGKLKSHLMNFSAPDLSQHPPRSVRIRLGGYVILPRMLDKCRAEIKGTNGPYHYACPIDQRFLNFVGVDAGALKDEVAKGAGDGDILTWIRKHASNARSDWEIAQWSAHQEITAPAAAESREFVNEQIKSAGLDKRDDLATWFDWLDADDFVSYGGKA